MTWLDQLMRENEVQRERLSKLSSEYPYAVLIDLSPPNWTKSRTFTLRFGLEL